MIAVEHANISTQVRDVSIDAKMVKLAAIATSFANVATTLRVIHRRRNASVPADGQGKTATNPVPLVSMDKIAKSPVWTAFTVGACLFLLLFQYTIIVGKR